MIATPSEAVDGRSARARRTREAAVEALHALINEGDPRPSARRIAERAGVSERSIFVHFATLEDLHHAVAERATILIVGMLWAIDPALPLAERVGALGAQRSRINEEIGPLRRAAALQEPFSPTLADVRANARRSSREQLERVFASELDQLDPEARRRRVAAVDAAISGETWDLLRGTHQLSIDAARATMEASVLTLLEHVPQPVTASQSDALRRKLTELDEKIARLVTAIESGSPSVPLASRLDELHAERVATERALAGAGGGRRRSR